MSIRKANPVVLLLFNLLLPISIMFPGSAFMHPFYMAIAAAVLLLGRHYRRLLKWLAVYALFWAVEAALGLIGGKLRAVLIMFVTLTRQFLPCLMVAGALVKDYGPSEIISALEPLRLPKSFIVALVVVLRYLPTFKREFSDIKESMRLRGIPYTWKQPIRSFEHFLVPQLFRCSILADEITAAGLSKGITNPARRTSFAVLRFAWSDAVLSALLVIGTGVAILCRF